MYNDFFGFRERPFKLVPNPAYLYLSRSHEEALAHLTYAVNHGEGFVAITGEVGTGKTTLCRLFLENLPPEAEAAYIFNPRLDELQLLQAINAEFGIDARSDSVKALVDRFNAFLMAKKGDGKQVLLLIDEAQNLTRGVLEQLRLLSNLETSRDKLLQIILVGQPELDEMLRSPHLRQLSQRITINTRLYPLNRSEVGAYIRHRIGVAAYGAGVPFARSAVAAIFRYSRGIPRLINVACDRALLVAFGSDQREITGRIARIALRELAVPGAVRRLLRWVGRPVFPLAVLGCVVLGVLLFYRGGIQDLDARWPAPPPPAAHKVPDENPRSIDPPATPRHRQRRWQRCRSLRR